MNLLGAWMAVFLILAAATWWWRYPECGTGNVAVLAPQSDTAWACVPGYLAPWPPKR